MRSSRQHSTSTAQHLSVKAGELRALVSSETPHTACLQCCFQPIEAGLGVRVFGKECLLSCHISLIPALFAPNMLWIWAGAPKNV